MSEPTRIGPSPAPLFVQFCPHSLSLPPFLLPRWFLFEIPRHIERQLILTSVRPERRRRRPHAGRKSGPRLCPSLRTTDSAQRASFQLLIVSHRVVKPKRRGTCGPPRGRPREMGRPAGVVSVIFNLIASLEQL